MSFLRKLFKRKSVLLILVGYFNGLCPVCNEHIGTDVFKDKVSHQLYIFCGHCNREIYDQLDKTRLKMYSEGKPKIVSA